MCDLISSAHIGVAYYQGHNDNVRNIAFSSEKVARYLQAGVPLLVNDKGNFNDLFSKYSCGIAVHSVADFAGAIQKIDDNYAYYSAEAERAHSAIYDYPVNFEAMYKNMCAAGIIVPVKNVGAGLA